MPKFNVKMHVDAYVVYETELEAENAKAAYRTASNPDFKGNWVRSGVQEFDDSNFFKQEVVEVPEGHETLIDDYKEICVSPKERDTILAALRFWQRKHPVPYSATSEGFIEIEHLGEPLSTDAIDKLCEAINV